MSLKPFTLKFAPTFRAQREAFLSAHQVPDVTLEASLSATLDTIDSDAPTPVLTEGALWKKCFQINRSLIYRAVRIAFFASLAACGSTLLATGILKEQNSIEWLLIFSAGYFLCNTLAQAASYRNNRLRYWIALNAETFLVSVISRKLLSISPEAATRLSSGNLKVLITSDAKAVAEFLNNFVRNFIPSLVALAITTPILISISGKAGVIGILIMLLLLPTAGALNTINNYYSEKTQARLDDFTSVIGEWIKNIRLIRFLSWEQAIENRITHHLRQFMKVAVIQHLMMCLLFGLSTTWWMITATGILIYSNASDHPLDLSAFFGSLWLLTHIASYLTHIPNTIRLYGTARPSMKRVAQLLSEPDQHLSFVEDDLIDRDLNAQPTHLVFEKVGYEIGGKKILNHLSFKIDLAQKLAVLGEIGAGKTTLLRLVLGGIPPTQGKIWVEYSNGSRSQLWCEKTYHQFRNQVAYVPQTPYVSSDLFSTNLSLIDNGDETELLHSARLAELSADLEQLPLGLAQPIGESGVNLSGGQRQRLNLARAFYAKRKYLVLDDTLSAVDSKTEAKIMATLSHHPGFMLVTHRLSEIMSVDHVFVLRNGEVVESGSPSSLKADANSAFTRALEAYQPLENSPEALNEVADE